MLLMVMNRGDHKYHFEQQLDVVEGVLDLRSDETWAQVLDLSLLAVWL